MKILGRYAAELAQRLCTTAMKNHKMSKKKKKTAATFMGVKLISIYIIHLVNRFYPELSVTSFLGSQMSNILHRGCSFLLMKLEKWDCETPLIWGKNYISRICLLVFLRELYFILYFCLFVHNMIFIHLLPPPLPVQPCTICQDVLLSPHPLPGWSCH